ncbi:MAG: ABC transporter transmembrane region:ABC transporter:Peptidase C39 bacteriocin processing [Rhodospirillaceae bacterium]|nr:MAG: ABC transporter transmembrane region:ABC transporter:Peptidase C39 bacteriocin processing [Rhodospirillaceae bacterium]
MLLVEVIAALDTVKSLGAESKMQREWEEFVGVSAQTSGRVMAPLGTVAGLLSRVYQYLPRLAIAGQITFRNVTFCYPGTESAAIRNVSFSLQAGEKVAIMRPVGSGKSTLSRLLARLYDPDNGEILIDGTDLRQIDMPCCSIARYARTSPSPPPRPTME